MRILRKTTAAVLITAIMTVSVSCGGDNMTDKKTTPPTENITETSASNEDVNGFLLDELPEKLDFGGETVTILCWDHYEDVEFYTEEMNGDIVNDAYFVRNQTVEERLNIKLKFVESTARGDGTFLPMLRSTVMSGSGEYDIAAAHSHRMTSAASQGLLLNLLDVDYLDFDKPWWSQLLRETTTIGGKLMLAAGDISVSSISRMQGIYFNNDMIDSFSLEDPYGLVLSGDWTLDKMMKMTDGVYSDLNGNDKKDEADRFGFASDSVQLQAVFFSSGLRVVEHDGDDKLKISPLFSGERSVKLLEKLAGFLQNSKDAVKIATVDDDKIFTGGRGLFYAFPLGLISSAQMRAADFSYGFIPWPKYEESDDTYYTSSSNAFSIWGIPFDTKNPDMSGAVMEALASGGYRTTSPALFETAYKVKYNNIDSERQSRIFDMMRSNVVYDIAKLYATVLPFVGDGYASMIYNNKTDWSSAVESNRSAIQAGLDKLVETLKDGK